MYPLVSNLSPRQENRWSVTIKVVQENRGIVTIKEVQENRRGVTIKEVQKNRISVTRAGLILVEWSFFPENERNNQEQSHHSKKKI